jgi:dihydroorotase
VKPISDKLIQQVRVLDPVSDTDQTTDVLITNGNITTIAPSLQPISPTTEVINGQGLILAPGLVDLYSHSGEPGYENRETFLSLTQAALAGGFTRIAILPDTIPVIDNPATLALLQDKLPKNYTSLKLLFWGSLTQGLQGEKLAEIADLAQSGVIGFTDNKPRNNLNLLRRFLEYSQPFNLPIGLVATDLKLKGNGVMREGRTSINLGLPANPSLSETTAIAAILELLTITKTPVHLMRISTARGVELIKQAKEKNLPITASTTWMHLLLNTEAIASYNPNLKIEPPLGTEEDRLALIQGIKDGVIDAIAIDHTPLTYEEKTVGFGEAPPGVIGLEIALPLLWQNLVEKDLLSGLKLWRALSTNPLKIIQQKPISCQVGEKAELVLFDPNYQWIIKPSNLKSLSYNTPWLGEEIKGKIII